MFAPSRLHIDGFGRGRLLNGGPCILEHLIESITQPLMQAREQVTVAVKGYADRRVSQLFLDLLRVGSLRYEERGARVVEVGPRRGADLSVGPFPRSARRTGRASRPRIRLSTSSCHWT